MRLIPHLGHTRSSRRLRTAYLLLPIAYCLFLTGCGTQGAKQRPSEFDRLPRVEVVQPIRTNLERSIEISATIEPMEKVELCARVPGVIDQMGDDIDIGRVVKG